MFAFFCDIADIDTIDDPKKVKFLPEQFRIIPKLAITAKLFGIGPTQKDWELDEKIQFHRVTKGKKFEAIVSKVIIANDENDNSVLEIQLMYESECINDLFVESSRAIRI